MILSLNIRVMCGVYEPYVKKSLKEPSDEPEFEG